MIFEEKQKLNVGWIWALLMIPVLLSIVAVVSSLIGAGGAGTGEIIGSLFALGAMTTVLIVLASMTLHTRIDAYGVETRIKPFVEKKFFWREVESVTLQDHDNMQFGYKKNIFNRTETIALNKGQVIVLKLRNGRKFRIGTQRPEEAQAFLDALLADEDAGPPDQMKIDSDLLEELQRVRLAQKR